MDRPLRPMSPCVNICTLDDELRCMGCLRTMEEIRAWGTMSPGEQWALVDALRRRASRTSGPDRGW